MNLPLHSPGRLLRLLVNPDARLKQMIPVNGGKRGDGAKTVSPDIDVETRAQTMPRHDALFDGNTPHVSSRKALARRSDDTLCQYACESNRDNADPETGAAPLRLPGE